MKRSLDLTLDHKYVVIDEINIEDTIFVNKLMAIGIYPGNKVYITKLGNILDMICINADGVNNVIRVLDAKHIIVHEVDAHA